MSTGFVFFWVRSCCQPSPTFRPPRVLQVAHCTNLQYLSRLKAEVLQNRSVHKSSRQNFSNKGVTKFKVPKFGDFGANFGDFGAVLKDYMGSF